MVQAGYNRKILQANGQLTLVELISCQLGGGAQHPRSDCRAYSKPGRMVSVVWDLLIEMLQLQYFFLLMHTVYPLGEGGKALAAAYITKSDKN